MVEESCERRFQNAVVNLAHQKSLYRTCVSKSTPSLVELSLSLCAVASGRATSRERVLLGLPETSPKVKASSSSAPIIVDTRNVPRLCRIRGWISYGARNHDTWELVMKTMLFSRCILSSKAKTHFKSTCKGSALRRIVSRLGRESLNYL